MLVVDLFSGTGAATQAFVDRGHKVIRIDNNPKLKPDIVSDVRFLPLRGIKPDFVWASPPCTDFTTWSRSNQLRDQAQGWPENGLQLVAAACDAIAVLDPSAWAIENVRGAGKWLGHETKRVGAWWLWGRFPPFDATVPHKWQLLGPTLAHRKLASGQSRARKSAAIPYALSLALCMALERELA
jgi:hypothetical protein